MQPTIPSPEQIVIWVNLLMTGKATAKEQELQVGDHPALLSSTGSVSQCTRSLLSLLHSIITAAPRSYARDDKWRVVQGASGGHAPTAGLGVVSRDDGAVDAVETDET